MSRIHEALKKAAQERNAQASDRVVSDLVDLTVEDTPVSTVMTTLQEKPEPVAAPSKAILAFDEFARKCSRPAWVAEARTSVFGDSTNDQVGAEKFRTLRSRLYQIADNQPLKKVLVTSSMPAEGKTFVAANLAQSFVRQTDRRVLLIDADLRASRLHLMLGAPNKPGLADYLRGEADVFQVTQIGPSGNLCLIPSGTEVTNPSELLFSERMKHLLERMSQVFDWVIVDSPPALAVHDSSILADMCDGVLFVLRAGSTDHAMAEKASSEFREKRILGVVLNRVEKSDSYGGYYYGYSGEGDAEKAGD